MNSSSLRARIAARLPQLVLLLCLLQPCLDMLSYWLDAAGCSNTPTLLLRLLLLGAMVLLGFLLSTRRRYYFILAALLLTHLAGHVLLCMQIGYLDPISDLTNLVRIYQLPLITLSFCTYLRCNTCCLRTIRIGFTACLTLIILVELLSVLTATNPYTYPNKELGILGWFYFANAQSAILSMLVPVAVAFLLERSGYRPLRCFLLSLLAFLVLYFFATRLAYAALLGTALALAVSLALLKWLFRQKTGAAALALLLCAILAVVFLPLSPMQKNSALVAQNQVYKQADVDALVAADTAAAEAAGLHGDDLRLASLRSAYEKYLAGPTGRYGLERTAALYDYTTDVSIIADERLQKLNYCRLLLEDIPLARYFGLELAQMQFAGEIYDVENDFHGIYYLCGGVGLVLLLVFLAFFAWRIVAALLRDFRHTFTTEAVGCGIALLCGLAHAYFTAGVLRRPNTTYYLAVLLAAAWAMTRKTQAAPAERSCL